MSDPNSRVVMTDKTNQPPPHFPKGNVFIKNLDRSVDSNSLHQAFSSFGNILSCKVPHGKKGSKCHGFVQFETESAADAAINNMNGTIFYGKKLFVGHFLNREQRETTADTGPTSNVASSSLRTVYIKNLSSTVDSVFLKITCSPYGDVCNVKIIRDTDGSSKGFAFVTFKKIEEAEKAIEMLNGKEVDGRILFAGPAMKKAGKKQTHQVLHPQQQQHESKEFIIEDSMDVEQQQHQATKQQHRQLLRQQQQQKANLLPAMPNPTTQQHHKSQHQPASQLPLGVLFPTINSPYYQVCENNAVFQLPEIQHHFQQQQQKKQVNLQQQQKPELQHCQQPEQQRQPPHHDQPPKETQGDQDQEMDFHQKQQRGEDYPNMDATAPNATPQGVNLYVKHLDEEVDDATLKGMFSKFGEVISAKVMMEGEKSRGFGFVCFARAEDAARATRDMRRRVDDVNRKPLYVAPAQRKEERQAFFREKLKSRQNETQNGDIETTRKLLKSLDNNKESEHKDNSDLESQVFVNLPGGDSSNTSVKPKPLNSEAFKCSEIYGQSGNLDLTQHNTKLLEHREPRCTKLQNPHRSFPKRNSLFNFECFNVENLRTPLIKPTRLDIPTEERAISSPFSQSDADSNSLLSLRVTGDSDQIYGVGPGLSNLCPVFSAKPPDISKCTNDFAGMSRQSHKLAWRSLDSKDENLVNSSKTALNKTTEESPKTLTPIGCSPKFPDSESKSLNVRTSAEKIRAGHNYNLRSRPPNKISVSFSDNKGECACTSHLSLKNKKVPKEDLSFSGSTQNIPECFARKKDISTYDTLYDPQNAIPFSRNAVPEVSSPFSRNMTSQYSTTWQRSSASSDTESYITCCENRQISAGLKRGFASDESLLTMDPFKNLKSRTGTGFQEPLTRRSPNLKRRSDTSFDADIEDLGMGVNFHWRSKRRMISLPPQYATDYCPGCEGRPPSPALSYLGQRQLSLRTMTNLPTDQQKLVLTGPVRSHVNEALKNMVESCCDCNQSTCWSPDTVRMVKSLLDKNWNVSALSEKLLVMVMEMEVTEILSLLQSRDYLIYLITEGLAQIENALDEETTDLTTKESIPSNLETSASTSESADTESNTLVE